MTDHLLVGALQRFAYELNPLIQLHWRQLDDEWLVFEVLSGQTHQIDKVTAAVLMCFEAGTALSFAELLVELAHEFRITADDAGALPIASVVDRLAALGLITPETLHAAV